MSTRKKSKTTQVLEELLEGPLSFGDALNAARINAELSQGELGELVGMSRSRICDIEKGRRGVTLEKAAALGGALGMSDCKAVQIETGRDCRRYEANVLAQQSWPVPL